MKIFASKFISAPSKEKANRKKLKLLQQRQFVRKPRKCWYQVGQGDQ